MTEVPIQFVGIVLAPLLTAIGTLFWLVIAEKNKRIEEANTRLTKLEETVLPALGSLENSVSRLTDLYEIRERRDVR